tara:strand:- start:93 stop:521 length:429 start_codon:yes stop_codon:yes gene_type:complete
MKKFLFSFLACLLLFSPVAIFADESEDEEQIHAAQDLLNKTGAAGGYNTNPEEANLTVVIAKMIRNVFALLGIVMVVYTVWAGFKWMTAAGDSGQVDEAKNMLKNAVIGMAIMLMAFSIAQFVVGSLSKSVSSSGEVEAGQP